MKATAASAKRAHTKSARSNTAQERTAVDAAQNTTRVTSAEKLPLVALAAQSASNAAPVSPCMGHADVSGTPVIESMTNNINNSNDHNNSAHPVASDAVPSDGPPSAIHQSPPLPSPPPAMSDMRAESLTLWQHSPPSHSVRSVGLDESQEIVFSEMPPEAAQANVFVNETGRLNNSFFQVVRDPTATAEALTREGKSGTTPCEQERVHTVKGEETPVRLVKQSRTQTVQRAGKVRSGCTCC